MFDFTKDISIDQKSHKTYKKLQLTLYILALFLSFYLAFKIIFPTQYFNFSFLNAHSIQNTIINPRNAEGEFIENGKIKENNNLFFDAALTGNYSRIKIDIDLNKESGDLTQGKLEIKKSHQAFLYPQGENFGFKDGTLIKNNNYYYLVSEKKLRKFFNENVVQSLNFPKEVFIEVTDEELNYNEKGEEIVSSTEYPDAAIFKIDETYYILEKQKLRKFVSPSAYHTHYDENLAIEKNEEFLDKYSLDNNLIGFSDGTLISYGISAYVVSNGKILPINNVITFAAMGYDWSDVIVASGDEISLYEKDKLFTISSPHPDGTIFATREVSDYYIIRDRKKHLLSGKNIANSWLKRNPILVSEESLNQSSDCELKESGIINPVYSCTMPLDKFNSLLGKDFEFNFVPENDIDIDVINVSFQKTISWNNFKSTLRDILTRSKNNYVAPQP